VAPEELSASGRNGGRKKMSPRASSIATTTSRQTRGSTAVTPTAASGSSGRPAGSVRARRRSGSQAGTVIESSTASRKRSPVPRKRNTVTTVQAPVVRKPRASRVDTPKSVADLPTKGVTTSATPTRSKAQSKRGVKEGAAVTNLRDSDSVLKSVATPYPPSSVGGHQQPTKQATRSKAKSTSSRRPGKRMPACCVEQLPEPEACAKVQTQQEPAGGRRPALCNSAAIAPTTRNAELLGPIERYVGLDIGKATEFCEVRQEQVTARATVRKEKDMEAVLGPDTARARVVLEACRQAWYLYDLLTGWGHEVWVVDTTRVRQLGIGQHKRKNDRIDAEILARAAESGRVPRAHVLSHASQQLRIQLGVRRALVTTRGDYVAAIRSILHALGPAAPSCEVPAFVGKLKTVELPSAVRDLIEPLMVALEAMNPQIDKVDKQLEELCAEQPVVQLLRSAPGVGPIVSAAFVSVIDNPGRFRNAHQVESYLGLVPSESTSGKRKLGAITKQGNAYVRAMLVQASWNVLRQRASDPLKSWGLALSKKRGKRIAVVAVARRLAGILWAMWRNTCCYQPSKVGQSSARGKRREAGRTAQVAEAIETAAVPTR
jgi:transposase